MKSKSLYLLRDADAPFFKIGVSLNVSDRAKMLTQKIDHGASLQVICDKISARRIEQALHVVFAHFNVRRIGDGATEWFSLDCWESVKEFLVNHKDHWGISDLHPAAVRPIQKGRPKRYKRQVPDPKPLVAPSPQHPDPLIARHLRMEAFAEWLEASKAQRRSRGKDKPPREPIRPSAKQQNIVCKRELAHILGVSLPTIDGWVRRGLPQRAQGTGGIPCQFDTKSVIRWLIKQDRRLFSDEKRRGIVVNKRQLAPILGISIPTLNKWQRQGLPCTQHESGLYEFDTATVIAWLKEQLHRELPEEQSTLPAKTSATPCGTLTTKKYANKESPQSGWLF